MQLEIHTWNVRLLTLEKTASLACFESCVNGYKVNTISVNIKCFLINCKQIFCLKSHET